MFVFVLIRRPPSATLTAKLCPNTTLVRSKAWARALGKVPDASVQFGGDVLHRFSRVDISMAVAIEGGLVTPVIRGVDTLSLSAIAQQDRTSTRLNSSH